MDQTEWIPGSRVEIDDVGEGTIVESRDGEVEVAVSELETVWVRTEKLRNL